MKEKIYNPAGTNNSSPAEGMAAVNTFNPQELDEARQTGSKPIPKNFERDDEKREQTDDTAPTDGK